MTREVTRPRSTSAYSTLTRRVDRLTIEDMGEEFEHSVAACSSAGGGRVLDPPDGSVRDPASAMADDDLRDERQDLVRTGLE